MSVRREKHTTCGQSKFCSRDRHLAPQNWTILEETIKVSDQKFITLINDTTYQENLSLEIIFLSSGGIRFRISPAVEEKFKRFDCSKEETIVDQKVLSSTEPIQLSSDAESCQLKSGENVIKITYHPFTAIVYDIKGEGMIMNFNDGGVFETHRNQEKYPEMFEKNNFNGFEDVYKNGPTSVAMSFRFIGEENRITGLPAHTLPLSLPNTNDTDPIRLFNTDINEFEVGNGMSMYGAIPFILAHSDDRSVGLFWANPSETWVDIKHSDDRSFSDTRFMSEGGFIDAYIFIGDHRSVVGSYSLLTGRTMLLPRFALGYHQSRWGYMTQEDFVGVSKAMDQIGVPHDVMWLDLDHTDDRKYFTFHPSNFPNPKKMLGDFARDKRYVVTLVDPHLKAERSYQVFAGAEDKKLLLMNRNGGDYKAHCWPGNSAWPDYMNPSTRQWWESLFLFSMYSDSAPNLFIWNDMNEISVFDAGDCTCPRDVVHYGDIEEREVHNIYGHLMVSSTCGGLRRRTKEPMRPFILTRSFFAGSQKYSLAWSGDNAADWNHLRNSIQLVLSFGIGGMVVSGTDVGGFFNSPSEELLSRWFSVAAWTYPFFREHCHHLSARREINTIKDPVALKLIKDSIVERYYMLPYWYTILKESNETGAPLVRPLWWEFKGARFHDIDSSVMLGSNLLIVPFLDEGSNDINFELPDGIWYNFHTLKLHQTSISKYDDGKTLVLARGGSIIPTKYRIRKSSEFMYYDPFTLTIIPDEKGEAEGKIYEDDGKSEEFHSGKFIYRLFKFSGGRLTNSIYKSAEDNDFTTSYGVELERIIICGVPRPKKIKGPYNDLEFQYDDGVLTIKKPSLLIRDDWEIILE